MYIKIIFYKYLYENIMYYSCSFRFKRYSSQKYQNIRDVRVYKSLAETNKWGQMGRAGVIEIITVNN